MERKYKSLSSQIVELLNIELHSEAFDKVFVYCLEHMCLQTNIKDFHNKLKSAVDFKQVEISPSKFRLTISKSGYVLLHLRFYTVYLSLLNKKLTDTVYDYYMCQYDISEDDAAVIQDLLGERMIDKKSLRSLIRKKGIEDRELYAPEAIHRIIDEFGIMLPMVKAHISRVISKRLRFVMKTFNMTKDEFVSELLFSAIRAHYRLQPNDYSFEKQLNSVRQSVSNYAINLIHEYTSERKARLVNEGTDGQGDYVFSLKVVSENQMNLRDMSGEDIDVNYDSIFSSSLRLKQESQKELDLSFKQLKAKYGQRSKQARLLNIFCKNDCYMFNKWLVDHKYLRTEMKTTEEFLESKTRAEGMKIIAEYLETTPDHLLTVALPSMAKALGIL